MAISSTQRGYIRTDLGDPCSICDGTDSAFSNQEISDAWDRTAGADTEARHLNATKGLLIESLLNSAAKLADYTAGETSERASQIFANLEKMYMRYKPDLDAAQGTVQTFARRTIRTIPRQGRKFPTTNYEDDPNDRYNS